MDIVLIILLILLLGGGGYGWHAGYGSAPLGILWIILIVALVVWLVRGRRGPLV